MKNDVFKNVPEFLAVIEDIEENGFFGDTEILTTTIEGKLANLIVVITGYIPDHLTDNIDKQECIISPTETIKKLRKIAETRTLQHFTAKVTTKNWPVYDSAEDSIIGSKGTIKKLYLNSSFIVE